MKKLLFALLAIAVSPPLFAQESGTITSTQCVAIDVKVDKSTVGIQVTGTWSGTLQPQVSIQGQPAVNTQVVPSTSTTPQATITGNGVFYANVGGGGIFQVCGNTVGSGTANIFLNGSKGVNAGTLSFGGGSIAAGTTGQPAVYTSGSALGSSAAWLDATAFAGATVDVKLNACITAVATAGGGTCDARALGGNQIIAGPINLGDVGGDAITVLLPPQGNWNCTIADGVSACMTQYPNTVVVSQTPAGSPGLLVFNQVGTANPSYNYTTSLGAGGYLVLKGVKFRTLSTGHATANNIGFLVTGTFDFTTFDSVNVTDEKDANAVVFQNACCETVLSNFEASGNNAAGVQPLLFSTSSNTNFGLVARGLIVNGPGATQPNIKCSDTNVHQSSIDITDLYEESSTTDLTTAINQVDGCAGFVIRGGHVKVRVGSSTAALLSQTNNGNGKVILDGVKVLENGAEAKMLAFANSNGRSCPVATCNIFTDDKGWIGRIETQQYCKSSAGTCASAQRGAVSIAAAASSVVVATTDAPNDTSDITVTFDTTLGTALAVTCNTTAQQPYISAVTAGTSFTISTPATFTTNPGCFTFSIKK